MLTLYFLEQHLIKKKNHDSEKTLKYKKKYSITAFVTKSRFIVGQLLVLLQILELNLAHVMLRNASIASCSGMEVAEEAFII